MAGRDFARLTMEKAAASSQGASWVARPISSYVLMSRRRRYIQDFMRADDETQTARELYDRMLAVYPDRINPGSLWGSANAAKATRGAKAWRCGARALRGRRANSLDRASGAP